MRWLTLAAFASLFCSSTAAAVQAPSDIRWANERLTVRATDAPQAQLLAEVARLTGIEIVGGEILSGRRVTVAVTEASLDKGLAQILDGVNYVLLDRPAAAGGARHWVVRVHSIAGASPAGGADTGPIHVRALDALTAAEADDEADAQEVDEDDPDIDDDSRAERVQAARLTSQGAFGPKADVGAILKHSENYYNDYIRLAAIKAVGTRQAPEAIPRLARALGDEAYAVRNAAVEALAAFRDTRSLEIVGQMLEKGGDREFRVAALRVIALRAAPESLPHLQAVVQDKNTDDAVREAAAQLLEEIERRERSRQASTR